MNRNYNIVLQDEPAQYDAQAKGQKRRYPHKVTVEGRPFAFTVERHRHAPARSVKAHNVIDALERALSNKHRQAKVHNTDGQVTVYVEPASSDALAQKPHFTKEGAVLSDGRFVAWLDLRDSLGLMLEKDEQSDLPLGEHEVLSRDVDDPICRALEVMRRFARHHGAE